MSPELLPLLKKHVSFHRAGIEELARRLPPEAELEEWLSAAVQRYDEDVYVLLSLAALQAGRTLNGKHLERGLMMLGNDEHYGPLFAWRSQGDVPTHVLWAINNTFLTPKSQSALLEMVVIWCQDRKQALPPQVFSLTRQLFRSNYDPKQTGGHLVCIAALTQEPGLVTVAKGKLEGAKVSDFSKWGDVAAQTRTELLERWNGPITRRVPELPPAAPRVRAAGATMRRAVERVGRNEPCPCGSGKKYKHCCIAKDEERLHHSSHVAGKTVEEVLAAPEPYLTFDMLNHMRPHQVAQLDPLKINPAIMNEYLFRLPLLCLFDRFIEIAPTLPWDENMKFAWGGAMMFACRDGKRDVLKRLAALRTEEQIKAGGGLSFAACLMLADEQPAEQVKLLDKLAENVLANEEVDEARLAKGLTECALSMLYSSHRGLGILIARGFIPLLPPGPAAKVLNLILAARDQLNLSPDDPFSDVVDKMLLKERGTDESADAAAFRKARRNLEKKAAEVRELKETLAKVQRDLELREKKEKRAAAESAPAPSTEEKKELAELRARLDGIKSALKQTHLERNEFRRDLEQAHVELEQLRAAQPKSNESGPPDQEESWLLPPEPASNQPVRMLEFPKKFEETLRSVPRHIARSTMVTLGQIAGGEPAGFVGARRLNVCEDITRQRIGGDYRLLLRLLPDRVQVVTLINRRDLDRTIKSLV